MKIREKSTSGKLETFLLLKGHRTAKKERRRGRKWPETRNVGHRDAAATCCAATLFNEKKAISHIDHEVVSLVSQLAEDAVA